MAAATEAGGNVVSGPELRLVDPEKADNAAYAAAYKAARARAEAYAEAADLEVRRVLTIRDGGGGGGRPMPYEMDGAANLMGQATAVEVAAPPPPVMVGEGTRIVRVRVDFALK